MKRKVCEGETLADVGVSVYGKIEGMLEIALLNGLSVTARLEDGMELEVGVWDNDDVVAGIYKAEGVRPATEPGREVAATSPWGGIGFMGIGIDFEVV